MEDAGVATERVEATETDTPIPVGRIIPKMEWQFSVGQRVEWMDGEMSSIVRFRDRLTGNREIYGVDAPDDDRGLRFYLADVLIATTA